MNLDAMLAFERGISNGESLFAGPQRAKHASGKLGETAENLHGLPPIDETLRRWQCARHTENFCRLLSERETNSSRCLPLPHQAAGHVNQRPGSG
jgi:hypothetical protein